MTSSKKKIAGIIMAVLAALGYGSYQFGGMGDSTAKFSTVGNMGTSGPMYLAANTSTQVIGTSSTREILTITNLSINPIFCSANGDKAAVAFQGIFISTTTTFTFGQDFPYTGAVRCIAPYGPASTSIYAKQGN